MFFPVTKNHQSKTIFGVSCLRARNSSAKVQTKKFFRRQPTVLCVIITTHYDFSHVVVLLLSANTMLRMRSYFQVKPH